jgi:hypothetical protein
VVQDLGPNADPAVLSPIVARLSEIIMKMARRHVGTNKPNWGEDIRRASHWLRNVEYQPRGLTEEGRRQSYLTRPAAPARQRPCWAAKFI